MQLVMEYCNVHNAHKLYMYALSCWFYSNVISVNLLNGENRLFFNYL